MCFNTFGQTKNADTTAKGNPQNSTPHLPNQEKNKYINNKDKKAQAKKGISTNTTRNKLLLDNKATLSFPNSFLYFEYSLSFNLVSKLEKIFISYNNNLKINPFIKYEQYDTYIFQAYECNIKLFLHV